MAKHCWLLSTNFLEKKFVEKIKTKHSNVHDSLKVMRSIPGYQFKSSLLYSQEGNSNVLLERVIWHLLSKWKHLLISSSFYWAATFCFLNQSDSNSLPLQTFQIKPETRLVETYGFGGMALAAIFLKASREDKVVWTSDEVICLAATTSWMISGEC